MLSIPFPFSTATNKSHTITYMAPRLYSFHLFAGSHRIWIVDNSGSMQKTDGHRLVETGKRQHVKFVECSRWEEITGMFAAQSPLLSVSVASGQC